MSDDQIESVVKYLWTLCNDPSWPRGDLNFPRAFFTEKAFPENEAVWTTGVTASRGRRRSPTSSCTSIASGREASTRVTVPVDFQQTTPAAHGAAGLGDVEFALRRAFCASLDHTAIFAAGGAVTLPTGKDEIGLGDGATIWEPFAMFGKGIGANGFVQMHGGYMASSNRDQRRELDVPAPGVGLHLRAGSRLRPHLDADGRDPLVEGAMGRSSTSSMSCRRCRCRSASCSTS